MKIMIVGHFNTGDPYTSISENKDEFFWNLDGIFRNPTCIYPPDKIMIEGKTPKYIKEWLDESEDDIKIESIDSLE